MKSYHLHDDLCPHCKAKTKCLSQDGQHCSGEWFEERTYHCGYAIRYSPNFSRQELVRPCSKDPARIKRTSERTKVKDALLAYVRMSDLDEITKDRWLRDIGYFIVDSE